MANNNETNLEFLKTFRNMYFKAHCAGIFQKKDEHDLTFIQRSVVRTIVELGKIRMTDLSKIVCLNKSALTRLIDSLERKNFVKREQSEDDRRSYNLIPTEKTMQVMSRLDDDAISSIQKFFDFISAEEQENVRQTFDFFLKKLIEFGGSAEEEEDSE